MCILATVVPMSRIKAAKCPHGPRLTRAEAAEHMACTAYGRVVNPRTVDRWADAGLITRTKVGGLQWVQFDRDELDRMGAGQVPEANREGGK